MCSLSNSRRPAAAGEDRTSQQCVTRDGLHKGLTAHYPTFHAERCDVTFHGRLTVNWSFDEPIGHVIDK